MATTVITSPEVSPSEVSAGKPPSFGARKLLTGASALIVATGIERGFGFLANLLAARFGGASTFGAYSLAMTTANNIAAYAGAGIGSTATRFSGEYPQGTPGYRALARALALVSGLSALVATVALFFGARPLASLLLKQAALTPLLEWASISAGVMILFECCRGFLLGQRRLKSLLLFSGVMGGAMIATLPAVSHLGPIAMICTQAGAGTLAIAAVLLSGRSRVALVDHHASPESVSKMARRVWNFGFVQLLGIVGLNAAGWWIASLVTRSDATLIEMGMFAVANQVRNIVALVPGLLTQSSYSLMADENAAPGRVLVFCTFIATLVIVLLGGVGIVVLPWLLPLLWGKAYSGGVLAGSLALSTAIVHMSSAPASARLTIVSLPYAGVINGIWSATVVALSFVLLVGSHTGSAATIAMAVYLGGHTVSAALVIFALMRFGSAPSGLLPLFAIGNLTALALGALSWMAGSVLISGLELATVGLSAAFIIQAGQREGFSLSSLAEPVRAMASKLRGRPQ